MKYLFFISAILMLGCQLQETKSVKSSTKEVEKVKDGVILSKYPDGSPQTEIPMKNGKKNGRAKTYYKNGKLNMEIDYVDGIRHGELRQYYETGILHKITPFIKDKKQGIEKKYHTNGKLAAEVPYHNGYPCVGLKEYLSDGSPRKSYPQIVVTPVDNTLMSGEYSIVITMSDGSKNVEYHRGNLVEGNCLPNSIGDIFPGKKRGSGQIVYRLPRGSFLMEEVNIIAKVKTKMGNYYITQRKYNVAAENRF